MKTKLLVLLVFICFSINADSQLRYYLEVGKNPLSVGILNAHVIYIAPDKSYLLSYASCSDINDLLKQDINTYENYLKYNMKPHSWSKYNYVSSSDKCYVYEDETKNIFGGRVQYALSKDFKTLILYPFQTNRIYYKLVDKTVFVPKASSLDDLF